VYQYIRENGGWDNWELLPIERVEFEFGFELKDRERHHMEALHATLNSCVPNRTRAEWHLDHPDYNKQYHLDHPDYNKQYYVNHKEEITLKKNQKHDCPCGGKYTHQNKASHMKTKLHIKYESELV
jgi:hypothetical protein